MGEVSTIGLDVAKSVFQVHGVDADGVVVIRRRGSNSRMTNPKKRIENFSRLGSDHVWRWLNRPASGSIAVSR
jgi:hypothetical protein